MHPPKKKAKQSKKKKDLVIGNAVNLYIHIFKISVSYVYIRNGLTHTESPTFLRFLFKKFSVKWGWGGNCGAFTASKYLPRRKGLCIVKDTVKDMILHLQHS